jgi:oxygen-dependent protoporphyrinogen oxidase
VEPLLGGVHAGQASRLSARSTIGEIEAIARRGRSIYFGLRSWRRRAASSDPVLVGLDGGLEVLVSALTTRLTSAPCGNLVDLRTNALVTALGRDSDQYALTLADGGTIRADAVVLATPAFAAADLLAPLAPTAASALRGIEYAELASVTLSYDPAAVTHPMRGTGFLVPQSEDRLIVGCSWLSSKWPQLASSPKTIIKCMAGRHGGGRTIPVTDAELIEAVHAELSEIMGIHGPRPPAEVQRWPAGMPQYTVGHAARVELVTTALTELPGLAVTGAAYHGVGIASCLTQAQRTAAAVLSSPGVRGATR